MSGGKFERAKDAVFKKLSLDELEDLTDVIKQLMITGFIGGMVIGCTVGAVMGWAVFHK